MPIHSAAVGSQMPPQRVDITPRGLEPDSHSDCPRSTACVYRVCPDLEPDSNDIVKCQLKRIDFDDDAVTFNADQRRQLRRLFPDGVCDGEQLGVERRPLRGLWLSFGSSPVNRIAEAD